MTTPPAIVRQGDLARAIRAADKSAIPRAVEITRDGTIRIVPALAQTEQPRHDDPFLEGLRYAEAPQKTRRRRAGA
jgi:hypothetical protein